MKKIKEFIKEFVAYCKQGNVWIIGIAGLMFILSVVHFAYCHFINGIYSFLFASILCLCESLRRDNEHYIDALEFAHKKLHEYSITINNEIAIKDNYKRLYDDATQSLIKNREKLIKIDELETQLARKQDELIISKDKLRKYKAEIAHNETEIKKLQKENSKLEEQLMATQTLLQKNIAPYVTKPKRKPSKKANKE